MSQGSLTAPWNLWAFSARRASLGLDLGDWRLDLGLGDRRSAAGTNPEGLPSDRAVAPTARRFPRLPVEKRVGVVDVGVAVAGEAAV